MRRTSLALTASIALAALAGCGTTTLDHGQMVTFVRNFTVHDGMQVKSVTCPDGVKEQSGLVNYCVATAPSGETVRVRVTQTNGSGHVTAVMAEMPAPVIEADLFNRLQQRGLTGTIHCPQHLPIVVGQVFSCDYTVGSMTGKIYVTPLDSKGSYRLHTRP